MKYLINFTFTWIHSLFGHVFQSIPADYVSGNHMNLVQLTSTLKSVCFSVYNQTLKHVKMKPPTTCLTGFGPVSKDVVLEGGVR